MKKVVKLERQNLDASLPEADGKHDEHVDERVESVRSPENIDRLFDDLKGDCIFRKVF